MVKKMIQDALKDKIELKPEGYLLNILEKEYKKEQLHLLTHICTAARIIYAKYWKRKEIPKEAELISEILNTAEMDILTDRLNEVNQDYKDKGWRVFYDYLEQKEEEKKRNQR